MPPRNENGRKTIDMEPPKNKTLEQKLPEKETKRKSIEMKLPRKGNERKSVDPLSISYICLLKSFDIQRIFNERKHETRFENIKGRPRYGPQQNKYNQI